MKRRFFWVLAAIVVVECSLASYFGIRVYLSMHARKPEISSVSVIHKENNLPSPYSQLSFYYEPLPYSTEVDTTPWVQKHVAWKYNNDTLNDRFDYAVKKPSNTFRIIAIGDSFTFGDHVNTADSWPERLEDFLHAFQPCRSYTRYEVINLGLRGIDIQYMTERYRIRGAKYDPDLVIWVLISRDLSQIRELMNGRAEEIYVQERAEGKLDMRWPWTRPLKISEDEFHKTYTPDQIARMQEGFFTEFTRLYAGPVLLAPIGDIEETYDTQIKNWTHLRSNILYGSDLPKIWGDPESLHVLDGHPSELGHMRIAARILEILRDSPQLLCR